MKNLIVIVVILAVVGLAAAYVIRAKKQGQKCIGCPHARSCGRGSGCCGMKDNSDQ